MSRRRTTLSGSTPLVESRALPWIVVNTPAFVPANRPGAERDTTAETDRGVDVFEADAPFVPPSLAGCCATTSSTLAAMRTATTAEKTRCMVILYIYRLKCP